ncbi:polysaccharide pyruvyl transferase family protein [Nonlabens xiamenensis]|uniref:polysaccharide pyruvyl transferase family protein n=1 Tax=Nonlabens xiamenensis TaxID=2341043 RepID=UPI000F60EF39|nr:polysaccharide pyruvyl transferase family protein [Nonlabens xiamenensis]
MEHDRLYCWSERYIQKNPFENYGDLIGPFWYEKITGRAPRFFRNKDKKCWQKPKTYHATVGSIIDHLAAYATVWGSSVMNVDSEMPKAIYPAVRGPLSRKRILDLNIDCPEIYGDLALLLPDFFAPEINKTHELGVIPHINDLDLVRDLLQDRKDVKLIDFNSNDVEYTTRDILSCRQILSSSLHGLIVAHAYGIPAVQVKFSDKFTGDGVKYHDYFLSVGLNPYEPISIQNDHQINFEEVQKHGQNLPDREMILELGKGLLSACSFKIDDHE